MEIVPQIVHRSFVVSSVAMWSAADNVLITQCTVLHPDILLSSRFLIYFHHYLVTVICVYVVNSAVSWYLIIVIITALFLSSYSSVLVPIQIRTCDVCYIAHIWNIFMPSPPDGVGEGIVFRLSHTPVHSSRQILLPWYPINGWNNFDKTVKEYSLVLIDDLIRFWRSSLKGQGHNRLLRSSCEQNISWTTWAISMKLTGNND